MNKSRKMTKHLITLSIAVLLICVGLSGCVESERGYLDSRFIGTWEDNTSGYLTFSPNGSYSTLGSGYLVTWEVKNEKLIYKLGGGEPSERDFSFSNDNNTLTIESYGGTTNVYIKISP